MTTGESIVVFDELQGNDKLRVVWGFFWRGIVVGVLSALGGGILGGVLGFVLGLLGHLAGWSVETIRTWGGIVGLFAGLFVGLGMLWLYVRWLFRAKWSGYQLRLVRAGS